MQVIQWLLELRRERRLGYRLLAAIVLASTCLALIATGIQLYVDYRRDLSAINDEFVQVERTYLDSLANSLWTFNDVQIRLQLDGLLQLPDMQYVEVSGSRGEHFDAGKKSRGEVITRQFILRYNAPGQPVLGVLSVSVALEGVYQRLIDKAIVIFVTQTTKTFFISLFILFIVSRWVTRHLEHMARYARSLSLDRLGEPVTLPRKLGATPDELDHVAFALNDMSRALAAELDRRAAIEAERTRLFDAYERSRRLLQAIIDNTTAVIYVKDLGGRYLLVNRRHRELFCQGSDIVGKTDEEFFPSEIATLFRTNDQRVVDTDAPIESEETAPHPDGPHIYISLKFPLRDADGRTFAVCGISTDITRRKRVEAALHESEQRFRDYAETASDWFWETGPDHRFTFISDRLAAYGVDPATRIGKARWDLATDQDEEPEKWQTHRAILDRHERFRNFVYRIRTDDGAIRFGSVSGKPMFDAAGRFAGYRGGARDVTDAVLADSALHEAKKQAEIANRAKSDFLANMSHELRTPLNAIIGFSEIMTSGVFGAVESDRYRSYAADIHTSALHLLDIINDILDLARIEAGKAEFHERSLPLIETVEQVLNLTGEQIEQASLSLVRDIDPDLPRVQADERAMRQILLNLISNAIKFTPRGGTITIGLRYEASSGVRLWVADTGIGIAPEDVSKLMRPFTQLDDVYRRRYQGTGLGLALVRSLTELLDGSVAIETAPGRGTTVTVSLPASRVVVALPGAANHA